MKVPTLFPIFILFIPDINFFLLFKVLPIMVEWGRLIWGGEAPLIC